MLKSGLHKTSSLLTVAVLVFSLSTSLSAQDEEKPKKDLPPVEAHVLETKDGVFLNVKYYPGTKGKDSIPIIMLHSCLLYTSPSPRDLSTSRMPSSA